MAKEINIPTTGMSSQHPMNLKENQYPLMLNGNIQTDISSPVTLTNEHSNILCKDFPDGAKVIGTLYVPEDKVTWLWITNPTDNHATDQIGYIKEYVFTDFNDFPVQNPCSDCTGLKQEDIPLEKRDQLATCTYVLVAQNPCLNFSIDSPVVTGVIKKDDCGNTLYFTDGLNPPRFLKTELIAGEWAIHDDQRPVASYTADCDGVITPFATCEQAATHIPPCTCCQPVYEPRPDVDCEKMRLFPQVNHICIEPSAVITGGSLRAGTYQLAVCYAGKSGERATRTFSASNPVSIFDPQQTLTAEVSYPTDLGIKFLIHDLESTKYSFIDIFVIANINNVTSVKQISTVDITKLSDNTLEYTLSTFEIGKDTTIDDIFQIFPVYDLAKKVTDAGNTLLWADLTGPKDLNLQQAVNKLSTTVRWVTGEANENFYADGKNAAQFRSYLRDEVYPLGIVFQRNNTLDTCAYPLIGRELNTAFMSIEPEDPGACLAVWTADIAGFVSNPGAPLFSYDGEWNEFTEYFTRDNAPAVPYSVVLFEGIFYVALTGTVVPNVPNVGNQPDTNPTDWTPIGTPATLDEDCYLCVIDDQTGLPANDVLEYPGCDKAGAPSKRWQVYNTACNRGETCGPEHQLTRCIEKVDTIICTSFQYSPDAPITAVVNTTSATGSLVIIIDGNATGIEVGMTVTGTGIDSPTATVATVVPGGATSTITLVVGGENIAPVLAGSTILFTPITYPCVTLAELSADAILGATILDLVSVAGITDGMVVSGDPGLVAGTVVSTMGPGALQVTIDNATTALIPLGTILTFTSPDGVSCIPDDCYTNPEDNHTPCADNYPTDVTTFDDPSCPRIPLSVPGCNPGFVRSRVDAEAFYNSINPATGRPYEYYLLCGDASLVTYSNEISEPYMILTGTKEKVVFPASTKAYKKYDFTDFTDFQATHYFSDPTPVNTGTDAVCEFVTANAFLVPTQNWLFARYNVPENVPINQVPQGNIQVITTPDGQCVTYDSHVGPLMYMFGETVPDPGLCYDNACAVVACPCPAPTNPPSCCDHTVFMGPQPGGAGDYWETNGPNLTGTINNTLYQSYWFNFYPTNDTMVIKSKLFIKYGYTWGPGDIRIDVYEGNPFGTAKWSTGDTAATYHYTDQFGAGTTMDMGVLVIGDVANSTNETASQGQFPLDQTKQYFVHVYLLVGSNAHTVLTTTAPYANCLSLILQPPCAGNPALCWYQNYGWMDICVNSPGSNTMVEVTLPELRELECTYEVHYREYETEDTGCEFQTFEYGDFAYWQSQTKRYPNNPLVWGDMCDKPIRHFKFPDCLVSKLQDMDPNILGNGTYPFNAGRLAKIYPIGIRVGRDDVKAWLEWAVLNGLITNEEKLSITGYKIVRGNRVSNKSIVAKGLIYDMWKYKQKDDSLYSTINTYYPNYPFNDLRADPYLGKAGTPYTAPNNGVSNTRYSFISPETTFNGPTIGSELKIESAVFGHSLGNFYQVRNHPKYILLSQAGITLATILASISLIADTLILIGTFLGNYTIGLANTIPVGSIVSIVGGALNLVPQFFVYARQWRDIIYNFGVPKNFAYYYAAVGNYHSSGLAGEVQNAGNKRRIILNSSYLDAGNYTLNDQGVITKINNYQREDSVYMNLDGNPIIYSGTALDSAFGLDFADTSRFIRSSNQDGRQCARSDRQGQVASFYASNKHYLPDQYGSIQDIDWLYTGECVSITWGEDEVSTECSPIFGGDTFIGRMTQRRKLPFFIDNPVGVTTSVDFQYRNLSNITDAIYYFNSVGESTLNSSSIQFKEVENNFDGRAAPCNVGAKSMYLDGWIYLFSYGIISYIGESSYNLNFRYATDRKGGDFYPHQSDIENWTQEYKMPIETPNSYHYYRGYSKQNTEGFFCTQPINYNNDDCVTTYRNRVINSLPDYDSDFNTDSWRIYLANDYHDFPLVNGQLVGMTGIERDKVVLRFENTTLIFNAYYTMDTNAGTAQIGTANMFAQKPVEYAKSDIGYGGSQHNAFISTQFGHFWVDAARSSVLYLPSGDGGLVDIAQSFQPFFNNNLPFYILKSFPDFPVDNNFKDIGITLTWDNRFDRLFLTKLDYELLPKWRQSNNPTDYVDYVDGSFVHCTGVNPVECVPVSLTDTTYFCNKSWTISYSPLTKSWISFHSFVPNYYIAHENYFQSGINFPQDNDLDKVGIWNHLVTNKSYQVYYGELYPYITDVVVKEQMVNKQLQSIEYQADFLRFQNDYDYYYNPRVTFNKMVIWSENQNSGNLELVPQVQNNLSQAIVYPRTNADSTSVLVTRKENNWRVNQFWDMVGDKLNNVPPMTYECHPYLKIVNADAIDYQKSSFKRGRLVSDYFTLRMINDQYSNYKIINKWMLTNSIRSYT